MSVNMHIDIHVCTYNEELMMPHFMEYYIKYASNIYVHDNGSTDSTVEIANKFGAIVDVMPIIPVFFLLLAFVWQAAISFR